MIDFVTAEPFHLDMIDPLEVFNDDASLIARQKAAILSPDSMCWTMFSGDEAIAVVGITVFWNGVAEIWSVISKGMYRSKISFAKSLKRFLYAAIDGFSLSRCQVTVRAGSLVAERWVKFLGFKRESTMKMFGPSGNDYHLYVRLQNGR